MRFVACCVVVLSHLEFLVSSPFGGLYETYLHNARGAVDYFFVLSGFGMMLSYMRRAGECGYEGPGGGRDLRGAALDSLRFALRHVRGSYPVYLLFLIVGIPYQLIKRPEFHGPIINMAITLFRGLVSACMLQCLTGLTRFSHAFNGAAWFYSTLFVAYLVSPWMMRGIRRWAYDAGRVVAALSLLVAGVMLQTWLFGLAEAALGLDDLRYGSPFVRALYVAFGMVLAVGYEGARGHLHASGLAWAGVVLATVWWLARNSLAPRMGLVVYAVDLFVCGLLVFGLALSDDAPARLLGSPFFVCLGGLSANVYLVHYLVRMYVAMAFETAGLASPVAMAAECVLIVAISLGVSVLLRRVMSGMIFKTWRGRGNDEGDDLQHQFRQG